MLEVIFREDLGKWEVEALGKKRLFDTPEKAEEYIRQVTDWWFEEIN